MSFIEFIRSMLGNEHTEKKKVDCVSHSHDRCISYLSIGNNTLGCKPSVNTNYVQGFSCKTSTAEEKLIKCVYHIYGNVLVVWYTSEVSGSWHDKNRIIHNF